MSLILIVILRLIFYYHSQATYPNGTKIRITDRVTSEPIRYSNSQYLKLSGFRIYLPLYPEVYYGDRVEIVGVVENGELKDSKLVNVSTAEGFLYKIRRSLVDFYLKSLPQPHSSLIAGVAIGSKESIPKDFWDRLRKTGTAHVVVASGMNVTLVSGFLLSALVLFLPRKKAIPLALVGVWSYALISGLDAAIIRAAIMGTIAFSAQELGRLNLSLRALVFSALLMLFIKPEWIVDVGFLLSFSATLSLIVFEKKVYGFLHFIPETLGIVKKDFSTSLAAQLGVAPILFLKFSQFNILSPFINVAVLWTIVPITMIGMLGGLIGIIFEPLGRAVLMLAYPLTTWFVWVVKHTG